ncbi:hypothetical protein LCGC14_1677440 [marine sediment metagenome]|uniref:Uncharacterized protein n=1 Tax=marine sediment metagenome TaxID=412755 RepID=A0A0F9IC04_9ZZZZ
MIPKEICPKHKKPRIYSYNSIHYCKNCLDELFKAICKAEEILYEKT